MTHALLLQLIEDKLRPSVEQDGGQLHVSGTPQDILDLLAAAPSAYRAILSLGGGSVLTEDNPTASTETVTLILQAAKGLERDPGAGVHRDAPGLRREAIYSKLSRAIGWMHAMTFAPYQTGETADAGQIHCRGLEFRQWSWLVLEDIPTRQIQIDFAVSIAFDAFA